MASISDYLSNRKDIIDEELDRLLPGEDVYPPSVHKAARYTVFSGGKRLRAIVALTVGDIYGYENPSLLVAACGIEMIHACSLMLDDLPCMDDASMRRGKKACHLVFGESTAVLAAIDLLNRAYGLIFDRDERVYARIGRMLTHAVGTNGLIGGQVIDLESEGKKVDFETLEYIHSHKTGALFTASALLGGMLAGGGERELKALEMYAKNLGLAFQITDDLLDVRGDERVMGKDTGKDDNKATFVSHAGVEGAEKLVSELIDFAVTSLDVFGKRAERLTAIAGYVEKRKQ